jgi:hypothetical protein
MHEEIRGCPKEEWQRGRSTRPGDLGVGVGATRIEVMSLKSLIEVPAGLDMAETGKRAAYRPHQFRLIDGPLRVVDHGIQELEKVDSR